MPRRLTENPSDESKTGRLEGESKAIPSACSVQRAAYRGKPMEVDGDISAKDLPVSLFTRPEIKVLNSDGGSDAYSMTQADAASCAH